MNLLDTPVETNDDTARDELLAKWKDKPAEEVLKAKIESDLYIKTLEKQKDELRSDYLKQREELLAKAKFEDLLDRFEKSNTPVTPPVVNEKIESQFKPEDIDSRVRALLEETRQTERKTANFNKVQEKLKERYGNNYAQHLKDTGLPEKQINEIAMESPDAFFRLLGMNDERRDNNFQAPPRSNQRNDQFSPKVNKRDWNYYQELKKTNPRLYLDPKIAVQMHNDAIALGNDFGMPD